MFFVREKWKQTRKSATGNPFMKKIQTEVENN